MSITLLAIRRSALGDILHLLPVLQALKARIKSIHLCLLVKGRFSEWVNHVPFIDEVWTEIRQPVDIVVDFQGLAKTGWLIARSKAWLKAGYGYRSAREKAAPVFTHMKINVNGVHIIDRHKELLSGVLGIDLTIDPEYRASFLIQAADEAVIRPLNLPPSFMIIHPTTSRESKNLDPGEWSDVVRFLIDRGLHPFLSCGPGEESLLNPWKILLPDARILPVLPLPELSMVISRSSLFLGGDTGPTHLADQMGVPVLARFRKWPPERNGPYFSPSLVFFNEQPDVEKVTQWHCATFS